MPTTGTSNTNKHAPVVGDYVLGKTLGEGSSGKVKLATHILTGEHVAIKIIQKRVLQNSHVLNARIRREIAVLKLLGGAFDQEAEQAIVRECHRTRRRTGLTTNTLPNAPDETVQSSMSPKLSSTPFPLPRQYASVQTSDANYTRHDSNQSGVLRLLDVYETEQSVLLVLEYCPGGDLFELLLENGYLHDEDARAVFCQLVNALNFCHRYGIAHRDLKLENVLLDSAGNIRLADFGMASLMAPGSMLETACGSPNYCAPEVLSGDLYDGAKSDSWSLGIILYAMVTGGLPFDDDNFSRLHAKVCSGNFHMPEGIDPRIADLIRGMLRVNPDDRMTIDSIIKSDWFNDRPHGGAPSSDHDQTTRAADEPSGKNISPPSSSSSSPSPSCSEDNLNINAASPPPLSSSELLDKVSPCSETQHTSPTVQSARLAKAVSDTRKSSDPVCNSCRTRVGAWDVDRGDPIEAPDSATVQHLVHLGLGDASTVKRRLRMSRPCIEKSYYHRIAAFVKHSQAIALNQEIPTSPHAREASSP